MRVSLVLSVLFLSCSCASTTRLSKDTYSPKAKDAEIEVFYKEEPKRPYTRIAVLQENSWTSDDGEKLIEWLKDQARKVGADAIIVDKVGKGGSEGYSGRAEAVGIKWKDVK